MLDLAALERGDRVLDLGSDAGLSVEAVRLNPGYRFLSPRALEAVATTAS